MPRRSLLTPAERESLFSLPADPTEFIRHYTLSESDLSIINQHRGHHNRLGFAVQLCYMRYPGILLSLTKSPSPRLLELIGHQIKSDSGEWIHYAQRDQTRREHLAELKTRFGFAVFTNAHSRDAMKSLGELALQTDKGIVLATALVQELRRQKILLPSISVMERICAATITKGAQLIYQNLTKPLSIYQKEQLDALLIQRTETNTSAFAWLRQSPGPPNAKHLLEHLERLQAMKTVNLPEGIERQVHQNRLLKLAREGCQMTAQHLRDLETTRRHATLVAILLETKSTVIDEIIDLHDRIIGTLFSRAKRKHTETFQASGKAINEKVCLYMRIGQALLAAKQSGADPFVAIEAVLPWEEFIRSVTDAQQLAQPEDFDYLSHIGNGYTQIRRYAPQFLDALQLKAAPAAREIFEAVETLKKLNADSTRKVPAEAPTGFVRKRWESLVFTPEGLDRRFYELCTLTELKNALRSGDIWVEGSRQFKDFDGYLLPREKFQKLCARKELPLAINTDCDGYLRTRLDLLKQKLILVNQMAQENTLPDALITEAGLKITPLTNAVPDEAQVLMQKASALLPHIKITELLLEVDEWTGFTKHFTHVRNGKCVQDRNLLLTALLADAINLGLTKMAESCPGTTSAKLSWLQAWHIRDETYAAALAQLVNAQLRQSFATHWGDGTSSSSDGQRFRAGGHGGPTGQVNPKYGAEPGVLFYTHISDQYSPFNTRVIHATVRDATYVLDGLLYHESDLRIEEHYTDTAGFTDHVFALMHILGFRFAPRIRGLADRRLFVPDHPKNYPALTGLIGGTLNEKHIRLHWDEILRLATSIKQGTVTASLMLRKLGSYPRQNGLAVALRELGRIERTLFTLDWFQDLSLRRRVQIGLNKGEAKNALSRAVFFNRLGEIRDRSFENQRYRASGLNLIVAAIILWNTVYLERAIKALKEKGIPVDEKLLEHLSPLGWEHINLTGDYTWRLNKQLKKGKFRPLRPVSDP